MKKTLIVFLVVIIAISLFAFLGCEKKETLYVYTECGFPPFEYFEGTEIAGVDIEIAKAIADELGMKLEVKDVGFDSIIAGISENNAIGLAGITITEERAENVDFSIPYFGGAYQYVIYPKNALTLDENTMVSLAQLKNKKLGVQIGTTGQILVKYEKDEDGLLEGATMVPHDNALIATDDIGNGCDYVIIDSYTAEQIVAERSNLQASQIAGLEPEEYGIAVKKGNKELLDKINAILERLIEEGKIDEWLKEHSAN